MTKRKSVKESNLQSEEFDHVWYCPSANILITLKDGPEPRYKNAPHTLNLSDLRDGQEVMSFQDPYYYIGVI